MPEPAIRRIPQARVYPLPRLRPRTLFVTPEIGDFVQTGGLGAVAAALPRSLMPMSEIRVLTPGYRETLAKAGPLEIVAHLPGAGAIPPCSIAEARLSGGLVAMIVLCSELYEREGTPYCRLDGREHDDNDIRFARLALAAVEIAERGARGWRPEVLHLNDWHCALAAGYARWRGLDVRTVMTVHNLAHQGVFDASRREALAIPPEAFAIDGVEFYGRLSFLKAGLQYSDHVTTVSATYAQEITSPAFGCGLEGLLAQRAREGRLTGIVNAVESEWDPRTDRNCPYLFDAQRWKGRYSDYIRGLHRLSLNRAPLFSFVARLVHQKGVDLLIAAAERIVARGGQLVAIGRGEADAEQALRDLARRHPEAIGVHVGFDAAEARAIFAASDFLLMPSRFEPCGISQMYAQRFGAIPVATRTGGLVETVEDGKTGLLFDEPTSSHFEAAIGRAFELYQAPKAFQAMRRAAMTARFDWSESAEKYAAIYRGLAARR